ncbi:unnamed protein product [Citrullus colocynthis]|uniref:TRF2/HOY1 PH-like domain-containing protein n=1 Tax=Citrullus colocynthis TaxID=252529 RepID=A0ABP0Z8M6_9ROSI
METLMKLPAIGLKLQISPSLLKQMQRSKLSKRKRINHAAVQARTDHNDSERLKASILGAMMLQIGSWQLVARNEGDLVAKFYFAKRQLVWEILRNGLKEKIEIEWSNIIGIQAFLEENKPGILEVELNHPPRFYKEIEPEPRKHTQWSDGLDFTGGQAYVNRRHCIVFPPRVLDKHYHKLKDKDKHLFELSQRPFPTLNFSYFPSELAFNQISSIQFEEIRFNIPSFPPHLSATAIHNLTSPKSVVDYTPHLNEIITHQDQSMEVLNKGNTMRRYEVGESSANYYNGLSHRISKTKAKDISKKENKMDKRELMVSILNPILLYIGRWKFEPINEKDELVVRVYFIRKKMCYEVSWKGFRGKIEFEWSTIMGIRASLNDKEPGILEVELSQPPKFYEEIKNVDQRAHDKWVDGSDFTRGQAPICRRHLVMFPPGMLDKEFKRLISFDEHLFELSQKPYPTINVPYFIQAPLQNHFQMTSDNQILQLPHAPHLTSIPQTSGAPLPSNSMLFAPTFGTVTMNSSNPQECSKLRVPQVANTISNSNGYLWNNDDNNNNNNIIIGGSIISNNIGCTSSSFTNIPIVMYSDEIWNELMMNNPNSSSHSLEASNGYFSNWPTDEYGVWLPPPQQITKQHMAPQI